MSTINVTKIRLLIAIAFKCECFWLTYIYIYMQKYTKLHKFASTFPADIHHMVTLTMLKLAQAQPINQGCTTKSVDNAKSVN